MSDNASEGYPNLNIPHDHAWCVTGWKRAYEVNAKGNPWAEGQPLRKSPLEYVRWQVHCETATRQMYALQIAAGTRHAEVFGIFAKLIEYAARHKSRLRGWLLDRHGRPLEWLAFCRDFSCTLEQVDHALGVLSSPGVDWLSHEIFAPGGCKKKITTGEFSESSRPEFPENGPFSGNSRKAGHSPGTPGVSGTPGKTPVFRENKPFSRKNGDIPGKQPILPENRQSSGNSGNSRKTSDFPGTPGEQAILPENGPDSGKTGDSPGIPGCIYKYKEEDITPPPPLTTTQSQASHVPKTEEVEDSHFLHGQSQRQQARRLLNEWREVKPPAVDPVSDEMLILLGDLLDGHSAESVLQAMRNYRQDCESLGRQPQYRIGLVRWIRDGHWENYLPENHKPANAATTSTAALLAAESETKV